MTDHSEDTIILDPPVTDGDPTPDGREFLRNMIEGSPKTGWSASRTAEQVAEIGLAPHALKLLQRAVTSTKDGKERARCYFVAGVIRERTGEFEAASRCYAAVMPDLLEPEDRYFALNNLGYCLNRLGRHEEAERICRRAIAADPGRFNAHKNLGTRASFNGRISSAAVARRIVPSRCNVPCGSW